MLFSDFPVIRKVKVPTHIPATSNVECGGDALTGHSREDQTRITPKTKSMLVV